MPYNSKSTRDLLNLHLHESIGLSEPEAKLVISTCRRYDNCRDEIEDLYSMALIAIMQAMESQRKKNREIKNRRSLIRTTVTFCMCAKVIRPNNKDLIYRCVNVFDSCDLD